MQDYDYRVSHHILKWIHHCIRTCLILLAFVSEIAWLFEGPSMAVEDLEYVSYRVSPVPGYPLPDVGS